MQKCSLVHDVMQDIRLMIVFPASLALLGTFVACSPSCIRTCNEEDNSIVCNQSLILISDVTNWLLEKNYAAYENIKWDCMGKESCDLTSACGLENKQSLFVHYFCVDSSHILSKTCNGQPLKMTGSTGYIQSPGYPKATAGYLPCKWQIDPPNDNVVVLSLHDITVSTSNGSIESCDGGLVVSGRLCGGNNSGSSVFVRRSLCGGDHLTSLVRCGRVEIEFSESQQLYPLRFWLSFYVHSKNQTSSSKTPYSPCFGWISDMDPDTKPSFKSNVNVETTQLSGLNSPETNIEVLIIMLSIISGISAVLLVILIVVCVRCRLLQTSRTESVFSDASPGLQAHYKYISSLECEKTRPQLADGYCEVADALPINQRGGRETPTSPAYAEVEQFAQLRKMLWSTSSEDGLRGSKPLSNELNQGDGEVKHTGEKAPDVFAVRLETAKPKRGVLGRRKHEKDKHGEKEKNIEKRASTGPKIIDATANKHVSPSKVSESSQPALSTPSPVSENECSTYEQVGDPSKKHMTSTTSKKSPVPNIHSDITALYTEVIAAKKNSHEHYTKSLGRVKNNAKHFTEKSNGIQQGSLDQAEALSPTNAPQKPPRLNKFISTDSSICSKTLPTRSSKACLQNSGTKYVFNHSGIDVLQTTGIVKNGIKKFEQSSTLS